MENQPNITTPEDQAKIAKSRILSDAELIRNGADYVPMQDGEPRLEVTGHQLDRIHREMDEDIWKKTVEKYEPLRREIIKENEAIDIPTFFDSNPEIKEKVECIRLGDMHDCYILKLKAFPEIGIVAESYWPGGDKTKLHFNYTDEKLPRTVYKEVVTPPGIRITSPDGTYIPKELDYGDYGKPYNPEREKREEEIIKIIENACTENGITKLAIRGGEQYWTGLTWDYMRSQYPEKTDEELKKIAGFYVIQDRPSLRKPKDVELLDARYPDVFTDMMGMPDYTIGNQTSRIAGYDTTKPYPTFDWHRET